MCGQQSINDALFACSESAEAANESKVEVVESSPAPAAPTTTIIVTQVSESSTTSDGGQVTSQQTTVTTTTTEVATSGDTATAATEEGATGGSGQCFASHWLLLTFDWSCVNVHCVSSKVIAMCYMYE